MSEAFGITDSNMDRAYIGWPHSAYGRERDYQLMTMLSRWTTPDGTGKYRTLKAAVEQSQWPVLAMEKAANLGSLGKIPPAPTVIGNFTYPGHYGVIAGGVANQPFVDSITGSLPGGSGSKDESSPMTAPHDEPVDGKAVAIFFDLKCPVMASLKDSNGRVAALRDSGQVSNDIPSAILSAQPDLAGGYVWSGKLAKRTYTLSIRATGTGSFQLRTSIRGQRLEYPPVQVKKGDVSTVILSDDGSPQSIKTASGKEVSSKVLNEPGDLGTIPGPTVEKVGAVPSGISISTKNLVVARWTTFRKITAFPRGKDAMFIGGSKMCSDGSRIAFNSQKGIFTINPDGSNLVRLSEKPFSLFDISGNGQKVVWFENDREGGLFVANSDGSGKSKLAVRYDETAQANPNLLALRITYNGSRLVVLSPEKGGVFAMNADGSGVRKLVTTKAISKLLGIEENGNHWRDNFDISADGSRIVMHFLWDGFAVNGDGSNLRRLTQYKNYGLSKLCLSSDGSKVAHWRTQPTCAAIFNNWDGGGVVDFPHLAEEPWNIRLSSDGKMLATSSGLKFYSTDGKIFQDLMDTGGAVWGNPASISLRADMKQACMQIDGPESVDQGRPSQLVVVEFNSANMRGAPTLADIAVSTLVVPNDGSQAITSTMRVSVVKPTSVGATWIRQGKRPMELNRAFWAMNDDGISGDVKAKDGIYSSGGIHARPYDLKNPLATGPVTLRLHVMDKDWGNMTVVDVAGLEIR